MRSLVHKVLLLLLLFIINNMNSVIARESLLFFKQVELEQLRSTLRYPDPILRRYSKELRNTANSLIKKGPYSITYYRCPDLNVDQHDYYSESTYWWSDPLHPNGPYIRKDGVSNPDCFNAHKKELSKFYSAVFTLSSAAYLFEDACYAEKAKVLLRVWFIESKTRMNPNAAYAQIIPKSDQKRGVGILDTRRLVFILEAVEILKLGGYWDEELDRGLKNWFSEYLAWLLTSEYGQDERQRGNNHSSWYAFQIAAYANFTGEKRIVDDTWQYCKYFLLEKQLDATGSQPLEMVRTRSFSYFIFNLEALALCARMAEKDTLDLWRFHNSRGASLEKSIEYIMPFIENPKTWSETQITPVEKREMIFLLFGGTALNRSEWIRCYEMQMSSGSLSIEPFIFLTNMIFAADDK